ncbi:MAG TPA: cupin domain-containing protein [Cyclobacteriaceae bacterium]|nr:cupin domain-containing protein [Cyclobacteriaceae bacterium]
MKKYFLFLGGIVMITSGFILTSSAPSPEQAGEFIIEHENDIAVKQPGPHEGGGYTTAFSFFSKAKGLNLVFRKRILHPGSSIGYHAQEADEIYYILSGTGELNMNDDTIRVSAGDAILTRPGNSHGLRPVGNEDLTILISYEQDPD